MKASGGPMNLPKDGSVATSKLDPMARSPRKPLIQRRRGRDHLRLSSSRQPQVSLAACPRSVLPIVVSLTAAAAAMAESTTNLAA